MISDLNHTAPYDGSQGFAKRLMDACMDLIDNIANNNVRRSLQLIRCQSYEPLHTNAEKGLCIEIPTLLHITSSYPTTWGLLHHAASLIMPSNEIITMLINEGLSLGAKDSNGCTPLHIAARVTNLSTIVHLTNYGACIKDIDNAGRSPLGTLLLAIAKRTYSNHRQVNSELLFKCITILLGEPSSLWNHDSNDSEHTLVLAIAYTDDFVADNVIRLASGCPSKWNRDVLHRVLFFTAKNKRIKALESLFDNFGEYLFKDLDIGRCLNQGSEPTVTMAPNHFTEYSEYNLLHMLYKESILGESRRLIGELVGDYQRQPCSLLHMLYMTICLNSVTSLHILAQCADLSPFVVTPANTVRSIRLFTLSPLSLAIHSGNLYMTKFLVSCLRYRLRSRDIKSVTINPVVSCVLSNGYDCLAYLADHMGMRQFAAACWQCDAYGSLPIHVLLKVATVKGDENGTEVSQAVRRHNADVRILENSKTVRILSLLCDADSDNKIATKTPLVLNSNTAAAMGSYAIWSKRLGVVQNTLRETNQKIDGMLDKISSTEKREEHVLYGKDLQWQRYQRWREVLLLVNSRDFVSKMRILIRCSAFDQYWDMLAQCILLAIGESDDSINSSNRSKCLWWAKFVKHLGGYSRQSSDRLLHFVDQIKAFAYPFTDDNNGRVIDKRTWSEITSIHASHAISKKSYFNELKSKALRKGKHIGAHVEYGLRVLKMWVDAVIVDGKLMHDPDNKLNTSDVTDVTAYDTLVLSELLDYRLQIENVITPMLTLVNSKNDNKAPTYLYLLDIVMRPERNPCSAHFQETYAFNVKEYVSTMVPPVDQSALRKDKSESCASMQELSNKLLEDLVVLLIERRDSLNQLSRLFVDAKPMQVTTECPLLSLCARGMWKAASALLHAWIADGYDVSKSIYVYRDGNAPIENFLFNGIPFDDMSRDDTDEWDSIDIRKVKVVTPLSLAVYSRQTSFVSTFLSSYPHYKVPTALMDYCLHVGYTEMVLLLATRINSFRASSFLISSANIDQRPPDYRVYTKHNIYHMTTAPTCLAQQLKSIMTGAVNKAMYSAESAGPVDVDLHTSGPLRGLCTTSTRAGFEILLMDGTKVPLNVFSKDLSLLRRALPIPLSGVGVNCSGITILHESNTSGDLHGLDSSGSISRFLLEKGSWRTLTVDRNGRYPVYNVLCAGDIKLAIQMLSRAISLQGSPMHIEDYHILHTVTPVSIDVERLFQLPAANDVERLRLQQEECLANERYCPLHYPTRSALIHAKLRKASVWNQLLVSDFSPFIQVSLSQSGCTIDSIIRARRILTLLGVPFSHASSRYSDTSYEDRANKNKLEKVLENADASFIDKGLDLNVCLQLKELLFGWLRNRNPNNKANSKPAIVEESLFLFHNFDCDMHDIGAKGHSKAFKASGGKHDNFGDSDEKENHLSLHDRLAYETKIQYKGMGSTGTSLVNSLNLSVAIIESWSRDELQGLEQALRLSYTILDLARWMVIEKSLQQLLAVDGGNDECGQASGHCDEVIQAKCTLEKLKTQLEANKGNKGSKGSVFYASGVASKISICEDVSPADLMTIFTASSDEAEGTGDGRLSELKEIKDLVIEGLLSVMKVKGDANVINMITKKIRSNERNEEGDLVDVKSIAKSLNETRIADVLSAKTSADLEADVVAATIKRMDTVIDRLETITRTRSDDKDPKAVATRATRVAHATASRLKDFFRAISYLHKNGDRIYKADVHNWIRKGIVYTLSPYYYTTTTTKLHHPQLLNGIRWSLSLYPPLLSSTSWQPLTLIMGLIMVIYGSPYQPRKSTIAYLAAPCCLVSVLPLTRPVVATLLIRLTLSLLLPFLDTTMC